MATTKATTLAHTLGGIAGSIETAEINRLDGVNADIQTQLDNLDTAKAPKASPAFTGDAVFDTDTLKVDATNNRVGIGNNSPISPAHISVSATDTIPTNPLAQNTDSNIAVIVNTNNSANYSGLKLETRTSGAAAWLIANEWQSQYLGDLVFRNRNAGTTSAERMRITSAGKVAIGHTGPIVDFGTNRTTLTLKGGSGDNYSVIEMYNHQSVLFVLVTMTEVEPMLKIAELLLNEILVVVILVNCCFTPKHQGVVYQKDFGLQRMEESNLLVILGLLLLHLVVVQIYT